MINRFIVLIAILTIFSLVVEAQDEKRKILSLKEQKQFLSKRLPTNVLVGPFENYGSLLFSAQNVVIHSDDEVIRKTALQTTFHDFYKPTWEELFSSIATQTKSSWSYDSKRDFWVFAAPARPKPFAITLADKWSTRDMGVWVGYKPATYPVGLDIYYWGTYSSDDPKEMLKIGEKIRNSWAMSFASKVNKNITIEKMKKLRIAGAEALFYEAPTPRPGVMWRQWTFVIEGKAFFIISTLPIEDKQSYAEVEEMVKSFRIVEIEKTAK